MKFRTSALLMYGAMLFSSAAYAHEPRTVGDGTLNVAVGWRNEPAFEDSINALDFIVAAGTVVNTIDLNVRVLYLKDDSQNARILHSELLTGALRRDHTNPNRFNIWTMPTKAGAYGFHIRGHVNGIAVNEVFICGGGTKHPAGSSFGCVESIQTFPDNRHK